MSEVERFEESNGLSEAFIHFFRRGRGSNFSTLVTIIVSSSRIRLLSILEKRVHLATQSVGIPRTLSTAKRGHTSHVLEKDAVDCVQEALHYRRIGWVSREDLIDSDFFLKLLSLHLPQVGTMTTMRGWTS